MCGGYAESKRWERQKGILSWNEAAFKWNRLGQTGQLNAPERCLEIKGRNMRGRNMRGTMQVFTFSVSDDHD